MKEYNELIEARTKYTQKIDALKSALQSKIKFEFWIEWHPADGHTIGDEHAHVAQLSQCLKIINAKGKLTYADYIAITI